MITSLLIEGEEVMNFDSIANEAIFFYQNLYKEHAQRPFIDNLFDSHILVDQVEELEKPFEVKEVKDTIFGMDNAKAPGPNGFSLFFFQKCWDTI